MTTYPLDTNQSVEIIQTQKWLKNVIIEHAICPFAGREFINHTIHYEIVNDQTIERQLEQLIFSCKKLDDDESIETSLLIFPSANHHALSNFDDYLDFVELATILMHKQNYEGIYQLASFHPMYCFEGSDDEDASNYTNRSPYPMLHILRESSIQKVLENYPSPENIPDRNIRHTRELGLITMKKMLSECL